jgi:hypothetical protein
LQPTPGLSVTYTKVAFQATHTSAATQTTADSRTLPATATPTILAATTPTIMATVTPTTAITIITIITTTATNVKMSDYNGDVIECSHRSRLNALLGECGQHFTSQSELIAHMHKESAEAKESLGM